MNIFQRWRRRRQVLALKREVVFMILDYRQRLTGSNRFLLDEDILEEIYPSYDDDVRREVWQQLVVEQFVTSDPMDGLWCVR